MVSGSKISAGVGVKVTVAVGIAVSVGGMMVAVALRITSMVGAGVEDVAQAVNINAAIMTVKVKRMITSVFCDEMIILERVSWGDPRNMFL